MPRVSTKKAATKKAATKKATTKKATTKRAATKKRAAVKGAAATAAVKKRAAPKTASVPAPAPKKASAIRDPYTKPQLIRALVEGTGLPRADVLAVLDELESIIDRHIRKRGAGQFTLPGLLKIRTVKRKATRARMGRNPFTGEEIMIQAKPARTAVKVTPLRGLKAMVE